MSTLSDLSSSLVTAVADAARRVVRVKGATNGTASGFIWSSGLVVAAEEVLESGEGLAIGLADGSETGAELVGRDPSTDVALLRAQTGEFADWPAAPVPEVGAITLVVGRGTSSPLAALGMVAETGPAWQSMHGGRIDARIRLGLILSGRAEGAAVVTPEGQLVGMAVIGPRRQTLVIPTETIARAIGALTQRGYVARGYLGVSLQRLDANAPQQGALVTGVQADGPGAKAGLVIGDIITTWDGTPVTGPNEIARALGTESVGRAVKVGLMRGGSASEIELTVGERRLSR